MRSVDLSILPLFTIEKPESGIVTGTYTHSRVVGENHIGLLFVGDRVIHGRFREVDLIGRRASFALENQSHASHLQPGKEYRFTDGYWGPRIEFAMQGPAGWEPITFEASDAVSADGLMRKATGETPPGWDRRPGGWDHEHCDVCSATIGQADKAFNRGRDYICTACYESVLVQGSIDFVVPEQT